MGDKTIILACQWENLIPQKISKVLQLMSDGFETLSLNVIQKQVQVLKILYQTEPLEGKQDVIEFRCSSCKYFLSTPRVEIVAENFPV